jgi:hypothetical protein
VVAAASPLLERDGELARVTDLVEAATSGRFGLAVVEGPAGGGKSAILGALAARAGERGMRVLRSCGLELERDYPFGVVRQLFEPAIYGLDGQHRAQLFTGAAALSETLLAGAGADSGPVLMDPGFALLHNLEHVFRKLDIHARGDLKPALGTATLAYQ